MIFLSRLIKQVVYSAKHCLKFNEKEDWKIGGKKWKLKQENEKEQHKK